MHKENIFETIYENVFFVQNYKYRFTLFSIFSLFNPFCFNLFSLQSTFFQSIFFSFYSVSIYSLFNLLSFQSFLFSLTVRNNKILTTSNTGKITPAKIPIFRFSDAISETNPTKIGPPEHPASPASASSANNAYFAFLDQRSDRHFTKYESIDDRNSRPYKCHHFTMIDNRSGQRILPIISPISFY